MTPAEELTAAATKLRADAEAAHRASPAPWHVTDEHVVRCADGMIVADRSSTEHPAERADLPYIAAVHPGVGNALALLLEGVLSSAREVDHEECANWCSPDTCDMSAALAVARQILGTTP
jgi:hypothetical protein